MRRRSVEATFKAIAPGERKAALAEAFRLAYAGEPFPIHFDVVFEKGGVTTTERFTLADAVFSDRADAPDLVGHPSASKIRRSRLALLRHPKHRSSASVEGMTGGVSRIRHPSRKRSGRRTLLAARQQ